MRSLRGTQFRQRATARLEEYLLFDAHPRRAGRHTELKPLKLDAKEVRQLTAFLKTLSGSTVAP